MPYVLPSFLEQQEEATFDQVRYNNVTLKIGQIIRINYPDLNDSNSPQITTYDLWITEHSLDNSGSYIMYKAIMGNLFGGVADYCDFTARANVGPDDTKGEQFVFTGKQVTQDDVKSLLGCTVIVACIDGNTNTNVIIGAVPNWLTSTVNPNYKIPDKDSGHFLNFMFNGINVNINKLGELFIQRQGATNADGTLAGKDASERNTNEEKAGSFIKINQDGEIILSATSKKDAINLSKEDLEHSVVISKDGDITITIDSGKTLEIKDKDSSATMTLGDGAKSVAIAENLQQLYLQLLEQLRLIQVPTAFGVSGNPINATAFPDWDDSINSKSTKVPK